MCYNSPERRPPPTSPRRADRNRPGDIELPDEPSTPDGLFGAVDLGSRSFHLTVARVHGDNIEVVDRLRESVRLAAGVRDKGLDGATWTRCLDSLARIGERIRDIPEAQTRAVGTNAFRQLQKRRDVLGEAGAALGRRVEVISGAEEARLIYHGVSSTLPRGDERRLVIDIGGGSTEVIIGSGGSPMRTDSLFMGCVSFTRRFFPGGAIRKRSFSAAETEARRELETVEEGFFRLGWRDAYGSSGTVRAAARLLRPTGGLTRRGLKRLRHGMLRAAHVEGLTRGPDAIPGLGLERSWDFPGGVAILRAVMKTLDLKRVVATDGALREGVLHDLIGRRGHRDVRDATIRNLMAQYRVDQEQAARVRETALAGLRQLGGRWSLRPGPHGRFLRWAAALHEIGLSVSFSGHHRHGAYIVRNSDMPGFSRDDQELLAVLIETHRQRLRPGRFEEMTAAGPTTTGRLAAILRLAVLLCRRRSREPLPRIRAVGGEDFLELRFPRVWLDRHPLTRAGLRREAGQLRRLGIELRVEARGRGPGRRRAEDG